MRTHTAVLTEHAVALTMLQMDGWGSTMQIGREMNLYHRNAIHHWLRIMHGKGRAERRHMRAGNGYEWKLTEAGREFATAPAPVSGMDPQPPRYNHRPLAKALGMPGDFIPDIPALPGNITQHFLEGKGER